MTDFFAIGGSGGNYPKTWKYKECGPTPVLQGWLLRVDRVPRINMRTNKPEYWDNGELKYDFRFVIQDEDGEKWYWFMKSYWKAESNRAVVNGIKNSGLNVKGLGDIGGMFVRISTTNEKDWSASNPRPWNFEVIYNVEPIAFEGCHDDMDVSHWENPKPKQQQGGQQYNSGWQAAQAQAQGALQNNWAGQQYNQASPYDSEIPF